MLILLTLLTSLAYAETPTPKPAPLLYITVGSERCDVLPSQVPNPELVQKQIVAASKSAIVEARHFRARVPAVSYFALLNEKPVLLFQDAGSLHMRKGDEANALVQLIDKICGKPKP